jgi:hypothetical protein
MARYLGLALLAAALAPFSNAQTYSTCNPLSGTIHHNPHLFK